MTPTRSSMELWFEQFKFLPFVDTHNTEYWERRLALACYTATLHLVKRARFEWAHILRRVSAPDGGFQQRTEMGSDRISSAPSRSQVTHASRSCPRGSHGRELVYDCMAWCYSNPEALPRMPIHAATENGQRHVVTSIGRLLVCLC